MNQTVYHTTKFVQEKSITMENIMIKEEPFLRDDHVKVVYRDYGINNNTKEKRKTLPSSIIDKVICKLEDVKPKIEQFQPKLNSTFIVECAAHRSIETIRQEIDSINRSVEKETTAEASTGDGKSKQNPKRPLKRIFRKEEISYLYPAPKKPAEQKDQPLECDTKTHFKCNTCYKKFSKLNMLLNHQRLHIEFEWQSIPPAKYSLNSKNRQIKNVRQSNNSFCPIFDQRDSMEIKRRYSDWLRKKEN